MLSVTLEPKARIGTNVPAQQVPKDPRPLGIQNRAGGIRTAMKIIYTRRTCLVDTDLTKMPD
ncbi:hypothetical protein ACFT0G_26625 [Streptomyces sp. NPDC057020]|uniref:hypothetical protein n=1 Tax=unclassified Streptomyces TaxID=2593676 RepID=UPI0011612F15|nr:hypothetical protein [Streptomyces sp. CB02009]